MFCSIRYALPPYAGGLRRIPLPLTWVDEGPAAPFTTSAFTGSLLLVDIEVESSARKHPLKQRF
jgi:hypothetical protein